MVVVIILIGKTVEAYHKKRLSRDEKTYYNILSNGVDNTIAYVLSWLKTHEAVTLLNVLDEEEFEDEFSNSQLHSILNKKIQENTLNSLPPLEGFYKIGYRLASHEIRSDIRYGKRDSEALNILKNYIGDLVYSVNVDFCLGVKDILRESALNDLSFGAIGKTIINSQYHTSKYTGASVDNRCVMISNTEYGRTVNTGVLQCYANNMIDTTDIVTAGDDLVCDECLMIEDKNPYSIQEAMNLLPVHPHCRCSFRANNIPSSNNNEGLDLTVNMTDNNITLSDII